MPAASRMSRVRSAFSFARRYAAGYFETGRFQPAALPKLSIETTNICNADCVFCANSVMERRKEPLSMEKFRKAVDEFAGMGGNEIDFNVTIGDPLLDPRILERARYVRRYPQFSGVGFVTTLQWLHRFDLDEFFSSGITWVAVSTVLSGREAYRDFFRVDKYDQMRSNLTRLIEENNWRGRPLAVEVAVKPTPEPIDDIVNHPDFLAIEHLLGIDLAMQVRSQGFYADDWLGAVALPAYLKKRPLIPRAFRPCRLLYSGLMLYSNGKVGACACRDFEASSELILGNVGDESLESMWKGQHLIRLRHNWRTKNTVPDICRTCRHYLY